MMLSVSALSELNWWQNSTLIHGFIVHNKITLKQKSNIEFDAVPIRQMLTKCSRIKLAYEVLCAKWRRKIWCKNILTLHRYRDYCVVVFRLNDPVYFSKTTNSFAWWRQQQLWSCNVKLAWFYELLHRRHLARGQYLALSKGWHSCLLQLLVCVCNAEVRLYLIILQCMNKHKEMLEVLSGPLAGQLLQATDYCCSY